MNAAEYKALRDGYRYTGIYKTDKEKLKQLVQKERANGFKVRTIGYSVYSKFKELNPAELTITKEKYKETNLLLAVNELYLNDLENQLDELQNKINDAKMKIRQNKTEITTLMLKMKDSNVPVPV